LSGADAFQTYQQATGGVLDDAVGLLKITSAQYAALKPLNFLIGGATFTLNGNAQIWPRSLNSAIGGDASSIYLIAMDLKTHSGSGLDFISGMCFLYVFACLTAVIWDSC
jgi:hypothetical protein